MKTNRTLKVKYKVNYDDDSKLLMMKCLDLIKAHAKWMEDSPWTAFKGEGRIEFNNIGVIEWKAK